MTLRLVRWLVVGAVLSAANPAHAQQSSGSSDAAPSVAEVLDLLAAEPGQRRGFTEHRFNALLSEPLVLEGYVVVTAEGALERVVQQPFAETATIDGDRATLEQNGRVREVDLNRRGRGVAYLRTLYALLRGDHGALDDAFELTVSGDYDAWELLLRPDRPELERWLTRVRVSGSAEQVTRIRMERDDGAWQDMRLK